MCVEVGGGVVLELDLLLILIVFHGMVFIFWYFLFGVLWVEDVVLGFFVLVVLI
jgi:hypothetical protein